MAYGYRIEGNQDAETLRQYRQLFGMDDSNNEDRRITRTYVLNSNGSATVTFVDNTYTDTDYGYWQQGNGYIEVIYKDGSYTDMDYLDLSEKKVYSGYQNYRSRYIGVEFVKSK